MEIKDLRLLNETALEYEDELLEQINMRLEPFGRHCPKDLQEEIMASETADFLVKFPRPRDYETYHLSQECAEILEAYLNIQYGKPLSKINIVSMLKQKNELPPKDLENFLNRNEKVYGKIYCD